MNEWTFVIGPYSEKGLEKELARALAACRQAAATQAARRRAKLDVLRRAAGGVICLAAGVWLLAGSEAKVMTAFAALLAVLGIVLLVRALRPAYLEQSRPAKALLGSLNQIESSQRARVQLSGDGMTICAAGHSAAVPLERIEAAACAARLCVLLHDGAATVLQKRDLVSGTFEAFAGELRQALQCPVVEIR